MTIATTMLRRALTLALPLCMLLNAACTNTRHLVQPVILNAPYRTYNASAEGEQLWAVAPLRNESGTSAADPLKITDALIAQLTEVRGLSALPLNRTLGAMRALGIASIDTPAQAIAVMRALKADAIVVGSITNYEPYQPLRMGLNLAVLGDSPVLFADLPQEEQPKADELMEFRKATTDVKPQSARNLLTPLSSVSVMLDSDNHAVLADIKRYANGRVDPDSALGWETYTRSMARFVDFSCFRSVELLLGSEAQRLAETGANNPEPPR